MRILKKEEDLMVELNPKFQRELFSELLKTYGRFYSSRKIRKASSMLYHYKNNRVKTIPKLVVEKAIKLSKFSKEDLSKNILRTFSARDSMLKILQRAAKLQNKKIKEELSIKIGASKLLEKKKGLLTLDVLGWLNKNSWIEKLQKQKGLIKNTKIERISKEDIRISYHVYSKRTKKCEYYNISLPKKLILSIDFCYFLGLLYGDGLNGARVGIVNKDQSLITWTSTFLKNYFKNNKIKSKLYLYQRGHEIKVDEFDKWLKSLSEDFEIYHNPKARGEYVFLIFITNNILRRILDDFLENLESLFTTLSFEQKGAFLAGFFDAEGNVNKLDRNLRFSQMIKNKVKTISLILEKEGYHTRYDGSSIIIGFKQKYIDDLTLFEKQVLPFLKHSKKLKETKELIDGFLVRECYKPILQIILESPNINSRLIANRIERVKCYGKLLALYKAGFVNRERKRVDESFKYVITDKGLEYLERK